MNTNSKLIPGEVLDWFPKPFGPGDIDGTGAKRLLGTPTIGLAEVLVRETAQNSWDAGIAENEIRYTINLRRLGVGAREALRTHVFANGSTRLGLSGLLEREEVWALEISDRGTCGLDGPIRNDLSIPEGVPTNFIDLVFHVGAPRDVHLGAGTYGFGKTIAYLLSSVGTVVLWSQCRVESGGYQQRIIGSAIGDGFDSGGIRYTGRHWWGRVVDGGSRVEPVVGSTANHIGQSVFASRFAHDDTGTSVLILDPDFGGEEGNTSPQASIAMLAEAIKQNLWPKMLVDQAGLTRMSISLEMNGVEQELPVIETDPNMSGFADCLLAVRRAQSGDPEPKFRYPVSVQEIRSLRPDKLLGHLALTRYPSASKHAAEHSVAYMRHQAELVVKNADFKKIDVEGVQWAGVFKPVSDVDDSFALAEPPAHDDWIPATIRNPKQKRDVNIALNRIKEAVNEYLVPSSPPGPGGVNESVAHVGDLLSDLVASTATGNGAQSAPAKPGSAGGNRRKRTPRAQLAATRLSAGSSDGWVRTEIDVTMAAAPREGAEVEVSLRVGIDGGSFEDSSAVRPLGWTTPDAHVFEQGPVRLLESAIRTYCYEARTDIAVDVATMVAER